MTKTDGDDYNTMTKFDRQRSETTQLKVYQNEEKKKAQMKKKNIERKEQKKIYKIRITTTIRNASHEK